jgi:hypothetical protein
MGTMQAFMIFVDFADQPSANDTTTGLYDFFFPNASTWYETSSYGKLSIAANADTSQFHRMPVNASDYAWNRGITYEQHEAYIQDALASYTDATGEDPPPVDVLYVVATRNAPNITYSPTFMGNVTTRDGTFVARKAVTVGYDAYARWGFKLINCTPRPARWGCTSAISASWGTSTLCIPSISRGTSGDWGGWRMHRSNALYMVMRLHMYPRIRYSRLRAQAKR